MGVRVSIEAPIGVIASEPEKVLHLLADVAESEGADRDLWLSKAIRSAGGTKQSVAVRGDPRTEVVHQATQRGHDLMQSALSAATKRIIDLIQNNQPDFKLPHQGDSKK